jgi:dTDP-glucose 4,6-dehydratase/UDP-glucose 4-epimerase/GDP-4-dehydro-6-deoxy-D-mannose reductase
MSIEGDIRDANLLEDISARWPITHVIHGAALTHYGPWERQNPAKYVDINIKATVGLLDWARWLGGVRQFLYVSTGDVYGDPVSDSPPSPQPETGPFDPPEFYALTKRAAEMITRRYGEIYGIPMPSVRLSSVFGPMERPTSGRVTMSLPYFLLRAIIEGRPFRTSSGTLQAGGDYVSAEEVARAIAAIIRAESPRHDAYNIADGVYTPVTDVLSMFKEIDPTLAVETVEPDQADWQRDPVYRYARWDAYLNQRLRDEYGWRPRPLIEQFRSYYDWVMVAPDLRCPPVESPPPLDQSIA